jgi:hypothetical protein
MMTYMYWLFIIIMLLCTRDCKWTLACGLGCAQLRRARQHKTKTSKTDITTSHILQCDGQIRLLRTKSAGWPGNLDATCACADCHKESLIWTEGNKHEVGEKQRLWRVPSSYFAISTYIIEIDKLPSKQITAIQLLATDRKKLRPRNYFLACSAQGYENIHIGEPLVVLLQLL